MTATLMALVRHSHSMLDFRLAGLARDDLVRALPQARSAGVGAIYVHAVMTEDAFVSEHRGTEPLSHRAQWAPHLPAVSSVDESWEAAAEFQTTAVGEYAAAVRMATLAWLGELSNDDLARAIPLDMVAPVGGRWAVKREATSLEFAFMDNVVLHTFEHAGEIGVLRGVMGVDGFPLGAMAGQPG